MMRNKNSSEKEQIAQLVLDNVLDGIITIDKRGIVESYNPSAKRIFGYEPEEVIGRNVDILMPEPYHSEHDTYMRNYLTTGRKKIIGIGREVVGKRKDGTTFPMDLAVTEFMIDGEPHFVGIVQDITNRKETEKALRKALRDDFTHTVKNLQNLVFKYKKDEQGHFIYTLSEGKLAQELDLMTDKLNNKRPMDIFDKSHAEELDYYYAKSFTGEHVTFEFNYKGRTIYNDLSPIVENGKVSEVVGSGVDITSQKKIETALALARDQALEASEFKSQFLANMSHEIRTPMNGIIGVTELMYDTEIDHEQRDFINIIRDSAQALLTIINDILDFSKMEAGKMKIDQVDFSMPPLVEGIAEILISKAYNKSLSLLTFIDPRIPARLHGDPTRLRQVLLNLTDNAIKFTSSGSVVVRAMLGEATDTTINVQFAVIDTGIGISDEEQKRLFQPFVQADGSTTRNYGGTGLGLAISKRLVELMGGEIGVISEKGQGTTFWFNLPLEVAESESHEHQSQEELQLESLRVLIVHDDPATSDMLKQYLDSWGMTNQVARNGIEALSLLKDQAVNSRPYDIALVNLEKSGMDSMTFATVIQQDSDLAATKLIYLTGFDEKKQTQLALRTGYTACLKQPVKQSYLLDTFASLANPGKAISNHTTEERHSQSEKSVKMPKMHDGLILLVEDNPVNRKVAQFQLSKLGYAVDTANNGLEAVEKHEKNNYSLILMDIQMPVMDGLEATKKIRELKDEKNNIKIIAMTANAMQSDREKYLSSGIDDYLSKPVKLDHLQQMLEKWMPDNTNQKNKMMEAEDKSTSHQVPIDIKKLEEVYGEPSMIIEFLEIFTHSTPALLDQLENAIQAKNDVQIKEVAHGLKGSAAVIEANQFSDLSKKIEHDAKQKEWDQLAVSIKELKANFKEIQRTVEGYKK